MPSHSAVLWYSLKYANYLLRVLSDSEIEVEIYARLYQNTITEKGFAIPERKLVQKLQNK